MIDRTKAPAISIPESVSVSMAKLYGGSSVPLYYMSVTNEEVVRASVVFSAGTRYQTAPFTASAAVNMLSEGTSKYSAEEIAEMLDFYGIYFDADIDRDYSVVSICSLQRFFPKAVELLEEILISPTYPKEEIVTYRTKRKQALRVERSKPGTTARERFAETLFGKEHPYGVSYSEELYDTLSREDIVDFYKRHYVKSNAFCVMSGNIGDEELNLISKLVDKLAEGEKPASPVSKEAVSASECLVEREGSLQSTLRIGRRLFNKSHEDYIPLQVAVMALGGYFGSRLIKNLREDKGYTYGIYSALVNMELDGYMVISGDVAAEVTHDAVAEVFHEIKRLSSEVMPTEDLDMVKSVMIGEMMRILDGPFGIADVTIENLQNGADNSYITDMVKQVKSLTPNDILTICKKYFQPKAFSTVIVGATRVGDVNAAAE